MLHIERTGKRVLASMALCAVLALILWAFGRESSMVGS